MPSRDLNLLHPELKTRCLAFMAACLAAGLHPLVTCTGRTQAEQEALYAQGRLTVDLVNVKRKAAGLPPITQDQNRKVTWTTKSLHLIREDGYCRAFDFCLTNNGKAYWDVKVSVDGDDVPDYLEAGRIAESVGLEWGGAWRTPDYPHCQFDV